MPPRVDHAVFHVQRDHVERNAVADAVITQAIGQRLPQLLVGHVALDLNVVADAVHVLHFLDFPFQAFSVDVQVDRALERDDLVFDRGLYPLKFFFALDVFVYILQDLLIVLGGRPLRRRRG